jgi:hypothetical protein
MEVVCIYYIRDSMLPRSLGGRDEGGGGSPR